nr:hypothetical protein [uncultured Psychroserpens sp.]
MRVLITSLLLLIALNLQAQNFKFGKVSKAELAEKEHPKDPTANAAVLFKRESIRFDYRKGDKLYFSPLLFLATQENPFKQDERMLPIDLIYPMSDKYMVNIMLPEGYDVESLPENVALDFADHTGEFKYLINQNGRFLQINVELNINSSFILAENYTFFKQFFVQAIEKESEKIVLKPI